jgi:hypothetical protein
METDTGMKYLILVNTAATWVMVGVIWVMQLVHYPLFANVGAAEFPAYELSHMARISTLVIPVMLVEAITAFMLALTPPAGVSPALPWVGLGLVVFIWGATFLFQDVQHSTLARGFDPDVLAALLQSNWLRTIAWTLRGLLTLGIVNAWMHAPTA